MPRLFGTDGIRGVANEDLTPDLALALGRAAGSVLAGAGGRIVVGRDTRLSGPMLESGLVAGLCSAGVDVDLLGILPTPAVAHLAVESKAAAGAVISASHNPVADNGFKFFSGDGTKLTTEIEDSIETALEDEPEELPEGRSVGEASELPDALDRYLAHLLGSIPEQLTGLRVVLDCAFGAAWQAGPRAFSEAGAEVTAIHAEPDGSKINVDCGSTDLIELARAVIEQGADIGFGFDGDADRVLAVDERGEPVDGDRLLGLNALRVQDEGALKNDSVVTTVMANLGFRRALEQAGIEVFGVPVGDKHVAQGMLDRGAVLGGEQSGHIIFGQHATTGDGILTALQTSHVLVTSDDPMSKLAHFYEPYPQVLLNVPVADRGALEGAEAIWTAVEKAEQNLGEEGRVLIRPSGTEPLVRVMVEAADEETARVTAELLADAVLSSLS